MYFRFLAGILTSSGAKAACGIKNGTEPRN